MPEFFIDTFGGAIFADDQYNSGDIHTGCRSFWARYPENIAVGLVYGLVEGEMEGRQFQAPIFYDFDALRSAAQQLQPQTREEGYILAVIGEFLKIERACQRIISELNLPDFVEVGGTAYSIVTVNKPAVVALDIMMLEIEFQYDTPIAYAMCKIKNSNNPRRIAAKELYGTEEQAVKVLSSKIEQQKDMIRQKIKMLEEQLAGLE